MKLKLVYRALRKISDWTVNGYYSEVLVEGQENVPKGGPLVVAATHHNEIIDIATLSITIPHGRHLSFWAKSSMFKNPFLGAILSSSGAIPVKRNPNTAGTNIPQDYTTNGAPLDSFSLQLQSKGVKSATTKPGDRPSLFYHTSLALSRGEVVGVFPEGTSYTQPGIAQILPGAGWVGVEYMKWTKVEGPPCQDNCNGARKEEQGLKIVPVAIVYTDKSRYRSRVCIRYGMPIDVVQYAGALLESQQEDEDARSKALVKKVMQRVEEDLRQMTINACDWDTVCAVSTARSILWGDEDTIRLSDWVNISQRLVQFLTPFEDVDQLHQDELANLKDSLAKYHAILHFTGIRHSVLCSLVPLNVSLSISSNNGPFSFTVTSSQRPILRSTLSILSSLPLSIVRLSLFLPPLLLYIPGYITGYLTGKLVPPGEDECVAQIKGVGGGLGISLGVISGVSWVGWRKVAEFPVWLATKIVQYGSQTGILKYSDAVQSKVISKIKSPLTTLGTIYVGVWLLVKWHGLLVESNYRQLQKMVTYFKLISAGLMGPCKNLEDIEEYTKPPLPAENPFIRKAKGQSRSAGTALHDSTQGAWQRPPTLNFQTTRMLAAHLLETRLSVCQALLGVLSKGENKDLVSYLVRHGAMSSAGSNQSIGFSQAPVHPH